MQNALGAVRAVVALVAGSLGCQWWEEVPPSGPVPWPQGPPSSERQCEVDADCEGASNACVRTVCSSDGRCGVELAEAGTPCEDGFFCSAAESCDGAGTCLGTALTCAPSPEGVPQACDEAEDRCFAICTDGRPLVDGVCTCPAYNCVAVGGARFCSDDPMEDDPTVSCSLDEGSPGEMATD